MIRVRWRVVRGVAGVAGLVGAVAGVPIGLMALGQPLPTALPAWHQVTDALQQPISDSTLLRAAGVACWLVWAAFVVAIAIEVVGQAAGPSGRRPGGRPTRARVPGLQRVARALVLTAALLLPQRGVIGPVAASAAPAAAATRPVAGRPAAGPAVPAREAAEDGPGEPDDARPPATATISHGMPANGAVRYVVQRYDSPWAIAERHLGDGTRWRELRDASGRSLVWSPAVGRPAGGARIIHPGEVLLVPLDRHAGGVAQAAPTAREPVAPPPTAPRSATGPAAPVAPRPTGPRSATVPAREPATPPPTAPAAPVAPPPTAPRSAAAPAASAAPPPTAPRSATSPAGPAAPPPTAPAAPPAPPPTTPAAPPLAPVDVPTMRAIPGNSEPRPPEMLNVTSARRPASARSVAGTLVEAGMVGAAVLALLRGLRRRQAQHRPPGRRIRLPGPTLAGSELAIRRGETGDRVALAGAAVDLLGRGLRNTGTAIPAVLGLLVDDDAVEVLLDRPAPAPGPWESSAEGYRWRVPSQALDVAAARESALLPALTSLGRAAGSDADVLINLEAAGLVAVAGQPARAAGVLHAMATHLCGTPWAGAVDIVLVGMSPGLAPVDRVRTAASIGALEEELCSTAEIMSATMAAHGCDDALEGRVRGLAGDGWPPTIVLSVAPMTPGERARLGRLARPGSGVVAVVAGPAATGSSTARWVVDADASPMSVDPLRLAVQPTVLDEATMADIAGLLEVACDDTGATLADPPYDRIDVTVERAPAAGAEPATPLPPAPEGELSLAQRLDRVRGAALNGHRHDELPVLPDADILVRVLGAVEVDGATEFKRAKGRELIVYLAMHPHGVGEAELDEALWPSSGGRVVAAPTRDSTVSVARRAVGGAGRLLPALGQGREKRYRLGPGVQSDWDRFCVLHRWGRDRSSTAALRLALEMVRGRPFEGVVSGRTYGWIHTEGHGRHIEAEVGDAADLAACLFLEAGDAVGARWAARQGLRADPYAERLWVRLMEAADVLGESHEVERVMDELDAVLELEGDFSGLHPNTLAAYDRFSRRHRFPADR